MSSERWLRLKTLFQEALDLPADARGGWLARMAGDDQALRREVEALLKAHDTAGDFLEHPPELALPSRIGQYEIERELGRGGMGVVYLGHDPTLHRRVAIKTLPAPLTGDPTLRERLRREARAAATISHPGIAIIHALEEADGELHVVSEYVPGPTLRELLAEGAFGQARATAIMIDVVSALSAAHDAGVVHRDLKPENVIVCDGGSGGDAAKASVKIVDFGIAQIEQADAARLTRASATLGTPGYMAPEQLAGLGSDARSDLYAAGIMLAELTTGIHPLTPSAPPLPEPTAAIVSRCLAAEPRNRYASARELLVAIRGGAHAPGPAMRWWEFHQGAAVVIYSMLMVPMWTARELIGGSSGRALFVAALMGTILSGTLRLHLWFTSRWYLAQVHRVRRRSRIAVTGADALLAMALVTAGLVVADIREPLAVLLLSAGLVIAIAFLVIEPVTARAAFAGTHRGADSDLSSR